MRGEHTDATRRAVGQDGSSPHARGTPAAWSRSGRHDRIIPACAGNTDRLKVTRSTHPDHPRMRGEHHLPSPASGLDRGSSPHARGTLSGLQLEQFLGRIIPAGAGNTTPPTAEGRTASDHPRRRGEHLSPVAENPVLAGSSPQARGTHGAGKGFGLGSRIIPAGAGNTMAFKMLSTAMSDHPRRRGEHPSIRSLNGIARGSSPQARGTLGKLPMESF